MVRISKPLDLLLFTIQTQNLQAGKALVTKKPPLVLCCCPSPKSMWMARRLLLKISASRSVEVR